MLKRYFKSMSLLLAISIVITLCAGCSSVNSNKTADNSVTNGSSVASDDKQADKEKNYEIKMWMFPLGEENARNEMWSNMIKGFEEKNPGVKVDLQTLPWSNRDQKLLTALAASRGPDCVYLNPDIVFQFAFNNLLMPLDQYMTDEMKQDFSEAALKAGTYDSKLYGLPILRSCTFHVYNLDLLSKIGMTESDLPKTYDEYEAMLKKLKEINIYGTYLDIPSNAYLNTFFNQLWSEGVDPVITADGKVMINNDKGKKVIERFARWYKEGYMPKDCVSVGGAGDYFLAQKVADIITEPYLWEDEKTAQLLNKFNWTVGPALAGEGGAYTYGTVGTFAITKDSKDVESTFKWLEWITNKDNMATFNKVTNFTPARKSIPNLNEGVKDEKVKKAYDSMYKVMENVHGEIAHPAGREMFSIITPELQAAMLGEKTAEQALADMTAQTEKIVKRLEDIRSAGN